MKKYTHYKPTNIEWIGEIPKHWEIKKLKYIANITLGKMLTNEDKGNYFLKPYLRAQNINWFKVDSNDIKEMWFSKIELDQYKLRENDLLVSEGGEVGRTAIWKKELTECYIQNSVHRVKIKNGNNPYYFLNSFFTYGHKGYFESIVNKISIAHLTKEKLKEIKIILPPIDEQNKIALFLAFTTEKINSLISKKQKLIDLLKEERAAVINQAVTKGIDTKVELKDSGAEWLEKIPKHWQIKRLKYLSSKIGSGVTPRGGAVNYLKEGIPFLRSQNVYSDGLRLDDLVYISREIHESMSNSRVYPNDVLLNITGASIGRCYFVPHNFQESNVNQHVCIIRPNNNIETKYLYYFLTSNKGQYQVKTSEDGISREGLNYEQLRNFIIALPDIKEQELIVAFLTKEISKIENTISKIQKEIDLLQEYHSALISEVVTGKIDVRMEVVS